MIVLDANILIRAVLGRRVRQLIDTYAGQGVRFFAPDVAFDDAEKYLPPLLKKRGKPDADLSASLEYLLEQADHPLSREYQKSRLLRSWPGAQKIREPFCNSDDFVASGDSGEMSRVIGRDTSGGPCNLPRD
jgi:hypothetical protein